jgi:hypothetical protein
MENNNADKIKKLTASVKRLCCEEGEYKPYENYSGRGMYGKNSIFAFSSEVHPKSEIGKKLLSKGLCVDNLGLDYIYYSLITV